MANVDTVNEQDFASLLVRIDQQKRAYFSDEPSLFSV